MAAALDPGAAHRRSDGLRMGGSRRRHRGRRHRLGLLRRHRNPVPQGQNFSPFSPAQRRRPARVIRVKSLPDEGVQTWQTGVAELHASHTRGHDGLRFSTHLRRRGPRTESCSSAGRRSTTSELREQLCRAVPSLCPEPRAGRYAGAREPFDDLLQVASLGLVKAIDRFDVNRGAAFSSFAVPTILGELKRYFRDLGWSVHVPRGAQERALKVNEAQERLTSKTGRPPTVDELAQYMELSDRGRFP